MSLVGVGHRVEDAFEALADVDGDLVERRVVDGVEEHLGIDGAHGDRPVVGLVDDDVARGARAEPRFRRQALVCKRWVAGAEDAVLTEVDVEFRRERRFHVDIAEDTEPLLGERVFRPGDDVLERVVDLGIESIGHTMQYCGARLNRCVALLCGGVASALSTRGVNATFLRGAVPCVDRLLQRASRRVTDGDEPSVSVAATALYRRTEHSRMFTTLLLGVLGALEVLVPRRVVDFWFAIATVEREDGDVELADWVYTVARIEGVVILAWLFDRRRRRARD